jgi:hypothetical protein
MDNDTFRRPLSNDQIRALWRELDECLPGWRQDTDQAAHIYSETRKWLAQGWPSKLTPEQVIKMVALAADHHRQSAAEEGDVSWCSCCGYGGCRLAGGEE